MVLEETFWLPHPHPGRRSFGGPHSSEHRPSAIDHRTSTPNLVDITSTHFRPLFFLLLVLLLPHHPTESPTWTTSTTIDAPSSLQSIPYLPISFPHSFAYQQIQSLMPRHSLEGSHVYVPYILRHRDHQYVKFKYRSRP